MTLPHPVDAHVGGRLKALIERRVITEEAVFGELGISEEQLQKYVDGVARIGSSRLYELSKVLDVPVGYFFEEFSTPCPCIC